MKKRSIIIIVALALVLIAAVVLFMEERTKMMSQFVDTTVLSGLPTKDASKIDTSHLANGVVPPTNKWFSGIALQKDPKTIFPSPLGVKVDASSFSYGLPKVNAAADTISGALGQTVKVSVTGATKYLITRYDELSVDVTFSDSTEDLGTARIIEGSPFIQFTAEKDVKVLMSVDGVAPSVQDNTAQFKTNDATYHTAGFNGATVTKSDESTQATIPNKGFVTFYALPSSANGDPLKDFAGAHISDAEVRYKKSGDAYETAMHINTDGNAQTAYSYVPHQTHTGSTILSYDTIYGAQTVATGTDFSFTTPALTVTNALDLSHISSGDKTLLVTTLRRDINATDYTATDSYYSGKELYRSAQLLQLAEQLGETNISSTIQTKLRQQLETWFAGTAAQANKYFYYDTKVQGIVGVDPSFGSDEFNDHHFHYGYFIYAASILAKYDSDFKTQYAPQVNLIVADIANYNSNEKLPLRRSYDAYFSHSWASGSAPFDDGNNQESSSEAINAWVGVSLWAQQIGNTELATEAGWMLSGEAAATSSYWLDINTKAAPFNNVYTHGIVSLNWGGKRDYSTFFSADPAAKMGIQLLPLSPTTVAQFTKSNVMEHVKEALPDGSYNKQFGDYLLMYDSLGGVTNQLNTAQSLPDSVIDNANSRSYMYAWIMSQK